MFDLDFDDLTANGMLNEWYAIPVIVLLIIFKIFAEKKYEDSFKNKDDKKKN